MGKKFNAIAWFIMVWLPIILEELDCSNKWFWLISIVACIPALLAIIDYNNETSKRDKHVNMKGTPGNW